MSLSLREKLLFHQIHPAKLVTDVSTAIVAAVLLWEQHLLRAIAVGLVLPVIASVCVIGFADLEKQKDSRFGRYVARSMTRSMDAVRVFGLILFWGGAWYRSELVCTTGVLVIAMAWAWGTFFKARSPR